MSPPGSAEGFAHRGIVEGYYGPPWAHEDRLWWVERLGEAGCNRYVVMPKDDPVGRDAWREPPGRDWWRDAEALIDAGRERSVTVGFGISPGLSIRYADREDRRRLVERAVGFAERGAGIVSLALDDVPFALRDPSDRDAFPSVAAAHVAIAHELRDALPDGVVLWFVPTDYGGNDASDYLRALGVALDPSIEVAWTGPGVLPDRIPVDDAARRAALLQRPLLLWDNVPVNDGPMRRMLHLGPWQGRDAALARHCSGVLLNPMIHARASWPTVASAFGGASAWRDAVRALGAGAADAFACFAAAHRCSPMAVDDRDDELEARLRAWQAQPDAIRLAALREAVDERVAVHDALEGLADRRLADEIAPWVASHHAESRRMAIALEAIATIESDATPLDRCLAWVRAEGRLTTTPSLPHTSYGPRRVFYPQLTSQEPERARFGGGPTLLRDRCLADEVIAACEARALATLAAEPTPGSG